MNVLVIASVVVVITIIFGVLLAVIVRGFSRAVTHEKAAYTKEKQSYNPNLTMGHAIPVTEDYNKQMKQARKLAAQRAALMPRGANLGIGSVGSDMQPTAFDGLDQDPMTAVRIAHFHSWEGLRTGAKATTAAAPAAGMKAPAKAVGPEKAPSELVPGVDYPYIEITDEMAPAEKRKARIANAKAKSAAVKALKASGQAAAVNAEVSQVPTEPSVITGEAVAAPGETAPSGEPVAGVDYEVIEITDDMTAEEKRKARIANVKAKSAAKKAFKQSAGAGASPTAVTQAEAAPTSEPTPEPEAAPEPQAQMPTGIPEPDLITITDDMDPDEKRKARIHNAKQKSAYKKALKEAGIDSG